MGLVLQRCQLALLARPLQRHQAVLPPRPPPAPLQLPLSLRPLIPRAIVPQRRQLALLARPLLRHPAVLLPRPPPAPLQLPLPSPRPSLVPARSIATVALVRNARMIRTWTNIARKGRRTVKSVEPRRKGGVVRMVKSVSQREMRNGQNVACLVCR